MEDVERRNDPNIDGAKSKRRGCGSLILRIAIGVIIFRLVLEIINICI